MRLVLAVLLLLTSPIALAIQVSGEGVTLDHALDNAFKVAIDNEVGVIIDTERHLRDREIIHNQILSYSAGYIKSYRIVHHITVMDLHHVTVDVEVASSKLKDFLLSSNHNSDSFNIDNIKTQIRLYKEQQIDGKKLLQNTLKYFPNEAFSIVSYDFNILADFHDPNKFYLQVPYSIWWDQSYLNALQELLTLFVAEPYNNMNPLYVQFDNEVWFLRQNWIMQELKKVFRRREFVSLNIKSLHDDISINTCVQGIRSKPGESLSNSRSLYTHKGRGIKFNTDRQVDSYILYPIYESDLDKFDGTTELTLSVMSAENCPENLTR